MITAFTSRRSWLAALMTLALVVALLAPLTATALADDAPDDEDGLDEPSGAAAEPDLEATAAAPSPAPASATGDDGSDAVEEDPQEQPDDEEPAPEVADPVGRSAQEESSASVQAASPKDSPGSSTHTGSETLTWTGQGAYPCELGYQINLTPGGNTTLSNVQFSPPDADVKKDGPVWHWHIGPVEAPSEVSVSFDWESNKADPNFQLVSSHCLELEVEPEEPEVEVVVEVELVKHWFDADGNPAETEAIPASGWTLTLASGDASVSLPADDPAVLTVEAGGAYQASEREPDGWTQTACAPFDVDADRFDLGQFAVPSDGDAKLAGTGDGPQRLTHAVCNQADADETEPEESVYEVELVKHWFDVDGDPVDPPEDDWSVTIGGGEGEQAQSQSLPDDAPATLTLPVGTGYEVDEVVSDDWGLTDCDDLDVSADASGLGAFAGPSGDDPGQWTHAVCNQAAVDEVLPGDPQEPERQEPETKQPGPRETEPGEPEQEEREPREAEPREREPVDEVAASEPGSPDPTPRPQPAAGRSQEVSRSSDDRLADTGLAALALLALGLGSVGAGGALLRRTRRLG